MENEASNSKAKIVTAIVVIAAVAIIYVITMGHPRGTAADTSVSDTPLTSSNSSTPQGSSNTSTDSSSNATSSSTYRAGTYSATGSYRTPQTFEQITVDLSVAGDGTVTAASVQQTPSTQEAAIYQSQFKNNYKQFVVGKKLSDINLSIVSGSSLTSIGFNEALQQIKSQAAVQS